MGIDIKARKPQNEDGRWYQNNWWGWRPIAEYVLEHVSLPEKETEYWQSNDGQKVSAKSARKIAEHIDAAAACGWLAEYVQGRDEMLAALPDLPCHYCEETGTRHWEDGPKECNVCHGEKKVRPMDTWYRLTVEEGKEFGAFCRTSGGFEIW